MFAKTAYTRYLISLSLLFTTTTFAIVSPSQGSDTDSSQPEVDQISALQISAPAGSYSVDPHHAFVAFQVSHLGLSNYTARFNTFDITLKLNPVNISQSAVNAVISVDSIDTGFQGDYKGTHTGSVFESWEDDLALSPKWFNGGKYPTISFSSTEVIGAGGQLIIVGDLTLLGTTKVVTLEASVTGSRAKHPMSKVGAIGFSATGTFKRSDFGMTQYIDPPLIGDEVTLLFEGEFSQMSATQ